MATIQEVFLSFLDGSRPDQSRTLKDFLNDPDPAYHQWWAESSGMIIEKETGTPAPEGVKVCLEVRSDSAWVQALQYALNNPGEADYRKELAERFARKFRQAAPVQVQPRAAASTQVTATDEQVAQVETWAKELGVSLKPGEAKRIATYKDPRRHLETQRMANQIRDEFERPDEVSDRKEVWNLARRAVAQDWKPEEAMESWRKGEAFESRSVVTAQVADRSTQARIEARKIVDDIAQEIGFTPEVGGPDFNQRMYECTEKVVATKGGPEIEDIKTEIRTAMRAAVHNYTTTKEEKS